MAGLIWLWNQGTAAADDGYIAAQDLPDNQASWATPEDDGYWATNFHETPVETPEALIRPPDAFDLSIATQAVSDEAYQQDSGQQEDYWGNVYGFPDQALDSVVAATNPPAVTEPFFAQFPLAEQPWFGDTETEDYDQSPALDDTAAVLFPPDVTTDFLATQPLQEQPWFAEQDTEDYGNVSDDVSPQFFPPAVVTPDEVVAAQPHYGDWQDWQLTPETEDYASASPLEVIMSRFSRYNTAEGGVPGGVGVTAANSGGASGDAFDVVNSSGIGKIDYAYYPMVEKVIALAPGLGTSGSVEWNVPDPYGLGGVVANFAVMFHGAITNGVGLDFFDRGGIQIARLLIAANGSVRIADFVGAFVDTAAGDITPDEWVRIEVGYTAASGNIFVNLYHPNDDTSFDSAGFTGNLEAGGTGLTRIKYGLTTGVDPATLVYLGFIQVSDENYDTWTEGLYGWLELAPPHPIQNNQLVQNDQPFFPDEETQDYANESSLDVTPAFFPPSVAPDDGLIAAVALPDQTDFSEPDFDYYNNPYDGTEEAALFPPDVTTDFLATQPLAEQPWFPDQDIDTELENDSTLEVVAQLLPPDVNDDFQATQYALREQPWFPDQDIDTELANDSTLDVTAAFLPPDVTGDFIATQPLAGQPWFPEQDTEDYQQDSTVDTSWARDFASGDENTIATEPLSEQPWFPDPETEDYDNSQTSLDVSAAFFPPPIAGDDLFAAQPDPSWGQDPGLNPEWDYTNDQPLVDGAVEAFQAPNDAFDTTIAAQYPLAEQPWFPDQETEDYDDTPVLEVIGQFFQPPAGDEFFAAQPLGEQPWFPAEEIDTEAQNLSTLEAVAQFFPPDDGYIAAQDLPDQWAEFDETPPDTHVSSLDTTAAFFPPAVGNVEDIASQLDPSVGQDWLLWPDPDPTNDQPLVDGAPEANTAGPPQEQEGMWQRLNRYHVNPGHWDDVSQGRALRWPP